MLYYLTLPFIYLVSILPFPLLYLLSDGVYGIIYYVIGYRKEVVRTNLRNAFPEKTEQELKRITKQYYHYFCDMFLETFKTLTISRETMLKRCRFDEKSLLLLNRLADEGTSIILVLGHNGNWEWAGNTFSLACRHDLYVIYHPLANRHFDRLMYRMRTRFGTRLIAMNDTFKEMVRHRQELTATAFIADQTPQPHNAHWMTFLNQDTPVFLGTERIAQKLKRPVLFVSVNKTGRGYYQVEVEDIGLMSPAELSEGRVTEMHTQRLEQDIIARPETWLWSHRRWKHKRPA